MNDCSAAHPDGDRCVLPATNHAHHFADSGKTWPNDEYVAPQTALPKDKQMTVPQFRQFTQKAARAARDAALDRVEANADGRWLARVEQVIRTLAAAGVPFVADDIWEWMPQGRGEVDPRAVGPVMMRLAREGVIVKTGQMQPSARRHATPMTEWVGATTVILDSPVRQDV